MVRFPTLLAVGGAVCLMASASASAQSSKPAEIPARCAALGPGAFAVSGSQTCVRVSGYVAAVAGFGSGPGRLVDHSNPFGDAPAKGVGMRVGARLDVTSDTDYGPMSLSIGIGRDRGVQP